jgi:hypothetical protein
MVMGVLVVLEQVLGQLVLVVVLVAGSLLVVMPVV